MAESKAARQEAIGYLTLNGEKIDLGEWVTLKEYARRYHLKSTNVISNWISRGVIPAENVRVINVLNNIRLVKAVPYGEV